MTIDGLEKFHSTRLKALGCAALACLLCTACSSSGGTDFQNPSIIAKEETSGQTESVMEEIYRQVLESSSEFDGGKEYIEAGEKQYEVVEDQSFDVNLEGWGHVRFLTCIPADGQRDYSLFLSRNGKIIFSFQNEEENPTDLVYQNINFIAFRDVNGDDKKDVLVSVGYLADNGEEEGIPIYRIRIYTNAGDAFLLDVELSDELNESGAGEDIDSAMRYIGERYWSENLS